MYFKGIRLEVPQPLYNRLYHIQQAKRKGCNRKIPLADIVIELCEKALPLYDNQGNCLLSDNPENIGQAYGSVLESQKMNELQQKERQLMHWEREIMVQSRELNHERILLLEEREELEKLAQESNFKRIKTVFESEVKDYQLQISSQKQTIEKLEKKYILNQEKIIEKLNTILRQTTPDMFKDTILPLLPALVSGIGSFLTNQKIEKLNTSNNSINP